MKRIAYFAHAGSKNHGCEAIVRTTTQAIKERFPDAAITLYSEHPDEDLFFKLPNLDAVIKHKFMYSSHTIQKFSPDWFRSLYYAKCKPEEQLLFYHSIPCRDKTLKKQDVFLSIGGDNYCYSTDIQLAAHTYLLKKLHKKIVLWGCSIGKENLNEIKINDLRQLDMIIARETITYQNMLDIGIDPDKLFLHADPAFMLHADYLPLPDGFIEGDTIGINFSPMALSYENKAQKGLAKKALYNMVEYILTQTSSAVLLVPHVTKDGGNDLDVLRPIYEQYKETNRVVLLDDTLNAEQIKGYIARCKAFVGARTHATIAAYSTCVPTLVVGYSVKSVGIAKDIFGTDEHLVLPVNNLQSENDLTQALKYTLDHAEEMKKHLESTMPAYIESAKSAADRLAVFWEEGANV